MLTRILLLTTVLLATSGGWARAGFMKPECGLRSDSAVAIAGESPADARESVPFFKSVTPEEDFSFSTEQSASTSVAAAMISITDALVESAAADRLLLQDGCLPPKPDLDGLLKPPRS